jgi:hypothetical protein
MATQEDVRRVALALPGAHASDTDFAFHVLVKGKPKGFAWVWKERVQPEQPRVANHAVLAVRVASLDDKEALIAAAPGKFFTEPHYNGFPAVLVRLAKVRVPELRSLLTEAHRCQSQPRARRARPVPRAQ